MLTVHHLNDSRSQRILWLLEELELAYDVKRYQRDAATRLAPPELKAVHPLGKSPVLSDGDLTVAESGAIIEHVVEVHGGGRLRPAPGTPEARDYVYWMHFAEGSAMTPILLALYTGLLGEAAAPLRPRILSEIAAHLQFMSDRLGLREWFVGDGFTAADIQLTFVLEAAASGGFLSSYRPLEEYLARMQMRPAYLRAIERGGAYGLGRRRPS